MWAVCERLTSKLDPVCPIWLLAARTASCAYAARRRNCSHPLRCYLARSNWWRCCRQHRSVVVLSASSSHCLSRQWPGCCQIAANASAHHKLRYLHFNLRPAKFQLTCNFLMASFSWLSVRRAPVSMSDLGR